MFFWQELAFNMRIRRQNDQQTGYREKAKNCKAMSAKSALKYEIQKKVKNDTSKKHHLLKICFSNILYIEQAKIIESNLDRTQKMDLFSCGRRSQSERAWLVNDVTLLMYYTYTSPPHFPCFKNKLWFSASYSPLTAYPYSTLT